MKVFIYDHYLSRFEYFSGINFSDKLARCVVVLGMPYSNIKSAELIEKMRHYDKISKVNRCNFNGNDYYENLCMK